MEVPDQDPAPPRVLGEFRIHAVLGEGEVLAVFEELCGAVSALHGRGLIHRDLKPENVFVVADRHAVLLDLGIAKELAAPASTTMDGVVRGTPAYMAPERFFGQPAASQQISTSSR
jgi:serine/threonine protein kinase